MEKRKPLPPVVKPPSKGKGEAATAFAKAKAEGAPSSSPSGASSGVVSSSAAVKPVATSFAEAKPKGAVKKSTLLGRTGRSFLFDEAILDTPVMDEKQALAQRRHIMGVIHFQNLVIVGLISCMLLGVPFFQPFYEYFALSPKKQVMRLINLDAPNMTNAALTSWAATSVTELMTLGFGDFQRVILAQKKRFTKEGWDSFIEAVRREKWREAFLDRQVVLTTAPSDTPVITAQGEEEERYMWKVEIPIIMTFVTNNNVTRRERNLISLTIVRVPTSESASGIAIRNWKVGKQQ